METLLNNYNISMEKIGGKNNTIADGISRNSISCPRSITTSTLVSDITKYVELNDDSSNRNDTISWKKNSNGQIIIDDRLKNEFIFMIHKKYGHSGISNMYYSLKDLYYVKNLHAIIKNIVYNCKECCQNKWNADKSFIGAKVNIKSHKPFYKLSSDIFGPFLLTSLQADKETFRGYIITITDIYSRYTEVMFVKRVGGEELIRFLKTWINKHEKPTYIISDNGKQYRSNAYTKYLNVIGTRPIYVPIYAPFSNGISERINRKIIEILLLYKNEPTTFMSNMIEHCLNNNYHRMLKSSPNEIINGYNFYDPYKIVKKKQYSILKREILDSKLHANKIPLGSFVYIKSSEGGKLGQRYVGPHKVKDVSEKGKWIKVDGLNEWLHVRNVKVWKGADCGMPQS